MFYSNRITYSLQYLIFRINVKNHRLWWLTFSDIAVVIGKGLFITTRGILPLIDPIIIYA